MLLGLSRDSNHGTPDDNQHKDAVLQSLSYVKLFRIDQFDLLAVQGTHRSLLPQFESINRLVLSLLYGPTLTSVHDYWTDHSFD